jgi:hypothetical protein
MSQTSWEPHGSIGRLEYPAARPPYEVLWTLTEVNEGFEPPYGSIIQMVKP